MDINFLKKNGNSFKLSDIAVIAKDFNLTSIETRTEHEEMEGRHGLVETEAVYLARTISVPFYFKSSDLLDFPLVRDSLYKHVSVNESFYVQEMRRPKNLAYAFVDTTEPAKMDESTSNELLKGKRYLVRLQGVIEIEQEGLYGEGELVFETIGIPFGESSGTTLDPYTFSAEQWQVGQGVLADNDITYAHSVNSFRIYNAGDVALDPRQMALLIKYQGASSNLTIKNNTTGDEWSYSGSSSTNDTITLDGIRSLKNGSSIFKGTNKKLITIAPGWNDFTLTGTSGSFLISYEHRFYYL